MFLAVFEKKWWKLPKRTLSGEELLMSDRDDSENDYTDKNYAEKDYSEKDARGETLDTEEIVAEAFTEEVIPHDSWRTQRKRDESYDDSDADDDASDDDVFSNNAEGMDDMDALTEAYELASSAQDEMDDELDEEDEVTRVNKNVTSPKEFFQTEVLSRYDVLDADEKEEIKGKYRVEIRGTDGGVWTMTLDNELSVKPHKEDADLVLMMHVDDFISVVNGKINPQLALASRRIKINGNPKKASLFQNILSPRSE